MSAARQQRYAIFLSGFNYSIEYRKSKANANADGLSRLPLPITAPMNGECFLADNLFYTEIMEAVPLNATIIAKESRHDSQIAQIINFILHDKWPKSAIPGLEPFFSRRHELTVQQGCLLWGHRIIPPRKVRPQLLDTLHMGHLGIVKMKGVARMHFWYPQLDKDIETITKKCEGCSYNQPEPQKAPLHHWQWPERPWERVHIDFAGPFLNTMFLIIIDAHTKWAEVFPVTAAKTSSTIHCLTETFSRFGIPNILVSDNGSQFTSNEFKAFVKRMGIRHITSAPFHPATNGLAERFVKSFKLAMKAAKNDTGTLIQKISRFLFAYRNAPQSTTLESPAFLMFGRRLQSRLDLLQPNIKSQIQQAQARQIKSHSQARLREFEIGDSVLVRDYRQNQEEKWQYGTIKTKIGPLMYEVEIQPGVTWRRHIDQMISSLQQNKNTRVEVPTIYDRTELNYPAATTATSRQDTSSSTTASSSDASVLPHQDNLNGQSLAPNSSVNGTPLAGTVSEHTIVPTRVDTFTSPSLPVGQSGVSQSHTQPNYTTRSGREVRKPNRYNE